LTKKSQISEKKENIKNNKLTKEDKAKILAEIKNIIKKADEQNRALGKIINDENINYK